VIKKTILNNGLRVIIEHIPTVRSVAIGIWVKTGSRFETPDFNGISHFIEHMLFKGTGKRNAQDIAEAFDSIGGNVNAFTSKEYTCYYAKVLDEHLDVGIDVLSDMFFNSAYDQNELQRERKVVIEEIKMYEDTPDDQIHDLLARAAFEDNSLGYSILGTEEALNRIDKNTILAYLGKMYNINNTVITVAGNVSKDLEQKIEEKFGGFNNFSEATEVVSAKFFPRTIVKAKQTEQAHLALALPGLSVADPNIYSLILLNNIIGGSMSSRLFQEIRENRGLAYSVYSYHSSFLDTGMYSIYAGTAPNQVDEVIEIIQNILLDVQENGITEKEITKAKEQLKGSFMLSLESTNSRMNRLGKNELLIGKQLTLDETIRNINQVNLDSISTVIQQIFSNPFAFSIISPDGQIPQAFRRDILV